jgi:hypothetical protein
MHNLGLYTRFGFNSAKIVPAMFEVKPWEENPSIAGEMVEKKPKKKSRNKSNKQK